MKGQWKLASCVVAILAIGCKEDSVVGGTPGTNAFSQVMQFSVSGVSGSSRSYTRCTASYDPVTHWTTVGTLDDSASKGKFVLQFHGNGAGTYAYNVTGSSSDVNQVSMRFVPSTSNNAPDAVFELTGNPADSLQAQLEVAHFGALQDSVTGTFSAWLRMTSPSMNFKILVYSGSFTAKRLE